MFVSQADRELIDLVAQLVRVARGFQQEQAFCEGITFTQFQILDRVVTAGGALGLSDLHAALEVDKSTTTRLVAPLLEDGLVTKHRREDDRRAFELRISGEGQAVNAKVWACIAGAAALGGEAVRQRPEASLRGGLLPGRGHGRLLCRRMKIASDRGSSRDSWTHPPAWCRRCAASSPPRIAVARCSPAGASGAWTTAWLRGCTPWATPTAPRL